MFPSSSVVCKTLADEFGLKLTISARIFGSVSSGGKCFVSSSWTRPQNRTVSPHERTLQKLIELYLLQIYHHLYAVS